MKMVQYRRDRLEWLVDAVLSVFDCVVKGFFWLLARVSPLCRQAVETVRKEPKPIYAFFGGLLIVYVGTGLIRCGSLLVHNATIYYMPAIDWWWVYILKLFH